MADFDNLLGEIDAIDDNDSLPDVSNATERITDPVASPIGGSAIPPALLEAENRRSSALDDDDPSNGYGYQSQDDIDDGVEDEEDGGYRADPDYESLKHLWIQELNCTEILPYDENTTDVLLEVLSNQDDTMDQLQEQAGRVSTGGGNRSGNVDPSLASLAAGICKMDSDRLGFVMADLMRARLFKIEKYALHNREVLDRMSRNEISYLKSYGALLEQHMQRSVTNHIKKNAWKKIDEPEMIERPNLDSYVFCRVVVDEVTFDNNVGMEDLTNGNDEDEDGGGAGVAEETFQSGSQLFVRYAVVRELVLEGKVELLM